MGLHSFCVSAPWVVKEVDRDHPLVLNYFDIFGITGVAIFVFGNQKMHREHEAGG